MNRLEQLERFYEDDPSDPFNIYALALEYQKSDSKKAISLYEKLLIEHESYIPTYYQLGNLYEAVGNAETALKILEKGIAQARNQKQMKALQELQTAYNNLAFD